MPASVTDLWSTTLKIQKKILPQNLIRTIYFFIVILVYIYHFQGLGPILNSKNVFCFLNTEGWRERSLSVREGSRYQIGWIFGKVPKGGGGVIFNPKIYVTDFGNFKQGFLTHLLDVWIWKIDLVCISFYGHGVSFISSSAKVRQEKVWDSSEVDRYKWNFSLSKQPDISANKCPINHPTWQSISLY